MNRIIKFRGLNRHNSENIDKKEWLYGFYNYEPNTEIAEIIYNDAGRAVHNETVGQFTGLTDKNGKEVYEGDVLRFPAKDKWEEKNYSCFEVFYHDSDANMSYNIGYSLARMHNHGSICGGYIPGFKPAEVSKMEVIGNIHENPELLS